MGGQVIAGWDLLLFEEFGIIKLTVATIVPGNDYFFFANDSR